MPQRSKHPSRAAERKMADSLWKLRMQSVLSAPARKLLHRREELEEAEGATDVRAQKAKDIAAIGAFEERQEEHKVCQYSQKRVDSPSQMTSGDFRAKRQEPRPSVLQKHAFVGREFRGKSPYPRLIDHGQTPQRSAPVLATLPQRTRVAAWPS